MNCMGSLDGARAWRFFVPVAASFTTRASLAGETPVTVLRDCSPRCPHFRREPLFTLVWRLGIAGHARGDLSAGNSETKPHENQGVLVSVSLRNAEQD